MGMNQRLLRPRSASAFAPTDIAGLYVWWDFSDSATVTLNSGNVSSVSDKSGNGNYPSGESRSLIQNAALDQPLYNPTLQNGMGGAVFDADASMTSGVANDWKFLHYGSDKWSIFIAGESKSDSGMFFGDMLSTAANGSPGVFVQDLDAFGIDFFYVQLTDGDPSVYAQALLSPFAERHRPSVFHIAGSPASGSPAVSMTVDTGSTASGSESFATNSSNPDQPLYFGYDGNNGSNTWKGRLYEIAIYKGQAAITASEANSVVGYLKKKWGIS